MLKLGKTNFFAAQIGTELVVPIGFCQNGQLMVEENAREKFLAGWVAQDIAPGKF